MDIYSVGAYYNIVCDFITIDYKQISKQEVPRAILVAPIRTYIQHKVCEQPVVSTMESMKYDLLSEPLIEVIPEFNDYDISLIERVTMSESSTQSYECQMAVAQTIINRIHSGRYGDTIESIVYEPNQYSTANNGDPSDSVKQAVQEVLETHPYPDTMIYFREGFYHKFAFDYEKFGVLYFSLYQ